MTGHASRATVDFDAFERELRQTSQEAIPAKAPAAAPKGDPLAELARIVGQDDPFRALLEAREKSGAQAASAIRASEPRAQEGGRPARVEPTFVDAPPPSQSPADAFDQYLASVEQGLYASGQGSDPAAFAEADADYRTRPVERPRGRNRLVQVGAGLAVVAVCVGGALAWRGTHGGGGPITVLADKTPLKVQPTASDGVEIPDQNKQIYDRNAKDGQIKIVNREEQPLDVNQAARTAAARNEGGEPGQGGATPGQGGLLTDSLGEPRRVRTVSVKPDTPVHQPQAQPQAETPSAPAQTSTPAPAHASASPIPTMTLPEPTGPSPAATPAAEPRRPARTLASNPAPAAEAQPAPPAPQKAPQRVASVSPETTASTAVEPPASSASLTAPVSGYSVQLGVRGSESEARAAFREMQGKYSQLAGKPELIRQAEVNGKTLYRVRVGPLAKNEASSLCSALQGAGGQCFVAKN